jgi:hypothetical protein
MYLFLSDETNTSQTSEALFLIYGAVLIPLEHASNIAAEISRIRQEAGYPADAKFKFHTWSRPRSVEAGKFHAAKGAALDAARRFGVRFMACVVHHAIAQNLHAAKRPLFALKTLLCEFDLFLARERTTGFCSVDRFEVAHSVLSKIVLEGVDPMGDLGKFQRDLSNIWMYSVTSIGCSHLCSMSDIVTGTFRYCVNASATNRVAIRLYPKVKQLFLTCPGNASLVENWGLFLRPKHVRKKSFAEAYDRLRNHLHSLEHGQSKISRV